MEESNRSSNEYALEAQTHESQPDKSVTRKFRSKGRGRDPPGFPGRAPVLRPLTLLVLQIYNATGKTYPYRRNIHKHCKYHQDVDHNANDCMTLIASIKKLIVGSYLKKYFTDHRQAAWELART